MQWQEDSATAIAKAAAELEFQGKYRHQFFQTPTNVEVNVLAKNLSPQCVAVHIEEQRLHVTTKDAEGQQDYELDVPLYAKVCVSCHMSCVCIVRTPACISPILPLHEQHAQDVSSKLLVLSVHARG